MLLFRATLLLDLVSGKSNFLLRPLAVESSDHYGRRKILKSDFSKLYNPCSVQTKLKINKILK